MNNKEKLGKIIWNGRKYLVSKNQEKAVVYNEKGVIHYKGDWKNCKPDGQGIDYYCNGAKRYEGYFKNGIENDMEPFIAQQV